MLLSNEGEMFFKPTCIGTASSRDYAVKNCSRIPLKFEWKMMSKDANMLTVSPMTGVIHPNESQVSYFVSIFSFPDKTIKNYLRCALILLPI